MKRSGLLPAQHAIQTTCANPNSAAVQSNLATELTEIDSPDYSACAAFSVANVFGITDANTAAEPATPQQNGCCVRNSLHKYPHLPFAEESGIKHRAMSCIPCCAWPSGEAKRSARRLAR